MSILRPLLRRVSFLWLSPDCFPAGTLILTQAGLRPIESIREGTLVLTHRNRWRPVKSINAKVADTVEVRGYGHHGLVTTANHPFYSKRITKRYPRGRNAEGKRPSMQRELVENPYWPAAETMEGKLWATPRTFPDAAIPTCEGAEFSEDFFYMVGRWVGDGSLNKGDVEICCGSAEAESFGALVAARPLRRASGEIVKHRIVDHDSSKLFVWGNAALGRWLSANFGVGCENKALPFWALAMQTNWRRALLAGYVDADGYEGVRTETRSVSRALSIGVRLLAVSLGHAAALYKAPGRDGQIEGRPYVGKDAYQVAWRPELQRETVWWDGSHMFSPVREVVPAARQVVHSLEVEEDESYVADGIVVHNCKHHSKAKGGKPVDRRIRGLAWEAVRWAEQAHPDVICLENVQEFRDWGPLGKDKRPDRARKGRTYEQFKNRLRALGYVVEDRLLRACDFGAPTTRERLFLVARCDGKPIVWPAPTHAKDGRGGLKPWRTAAECIDFSIPCPSIFLTTEEAKVLGVRRPLAEKTERRIARGVDRFVIRNPRPFIVPVNHAGDLRVHSIDDPIRTITGAHRGEHAFVAPVLVPRYGERKGQDPRARSVERPAPVIVPTQNGGSLVAAFLAKHNGGHEATGTQLRLPTDTITARDHHALVTVDLQQDATDRRDEVRAFLIKYHGDGGQWATLFDPAPTVVTKDSIGLVTVNGEAHVIADIGMRMLQARELFRCQGFPDTYQIEVVCDRIVNGKLKRGPLPAEAQVRMVGNSVCPQLSAALALANRPDSDGLIVDLFAGGGGTSLGLEWAFGRSPHIAINHDREAVAMHMVNHPETLHYTEDVRKVDIRAVVADERLAAA